MVTSSHREVDAERNKLLDVVAMGSGRRKVNTPTHSRRDLAASRLTSDESGQISQKGLED